jgi:hypothetical protein
MTGEMRIRAFLPVGLRTERNGVLVVLEFVSSQCEVALFMISDLEIAGFRDLLVCRDRKMRIFGSFLPVIAPTPFLHR